MLKKIKQNKILIIELIMIFIITLLFNLICSSFQLDELWNYGFSYNISTGLIPYKDFNMVVTPLYPLIGGLFLIILGKSLVVFHIFNALICTIIFFYMKKFIPKNYYIAYALLLTYSFPNYNIFCMLLLYILMNMENKKSNDYLIGIVLGLTFLTKQNIGIFLCLPTLFIKEFKRMFKRGIGFIIPNLLISIYLLINNCFSEFIDYAFLGVSSFAKDNISISIPGLIIIIIISIFLIYEYIKKKDINTIYLLSFQLLVFPMIEKYHIMIAIIPTLGYIINKIRLTLNKQLIFISFITFIVLVFSINIYKIYQGEYVLPNETNVYKYRRLDKYEDMAIKDVVAYIKKYEGTLYIIAKNAYTFKLESQIPINKYDLLNDGNFGSGGYKKIIEEIDETCEKEKCVFFVNKDELKEDIPSVYNKDIVKYVIKKYYEKESVNGLTIHTNY